MAGSVKKHQSTQECSSVLMAELLAFQLRRTNPGQKLRVSYGLLRSYADLFLKCRLVRDQPQLMEGPERWEMKSHRLTWKLAPWWPPHAAHRFCPHLEEPALCGLLMLVFPHFSRVLLK